MRHRKQRHQLGVKKEHRAAIMASLASALFRHDRIETTLGYAKALRPFAEKLITMAKKAAAAEDAAQKLHFRRLALAKLRDNSAVYFLFDQKVAKFANRQGGYTRIYKLVRRLSDAAEMAIIELVEADDEPNKKATKAAGKKAAKKTAKKEAKVEEATAESTEAPAEEAKPAKKTATKKVAKKAATKKVAKKADDSEQK